MEEDIKILEKYLKVGIFLNNRGCQALENLIKGYRELEEENEELKRLSNNKQWISPCYVAENYVPKSKIKEKLEELEHEKFKRTYLGFFPKNNCENRILLAKIQVLQELMEDK